MQRQWSSLLMGYRFLMALARFQLHHWRSTISYEMRCVLGFACALFALMPSYLFAQLPKGWLDLLLEHLFTPQGIIIAVILLYLSILNFILIIVGSKVVRTL